MSEWKTVSIRQELVKEITQVVRTGRYRSISEFVSEAIRLRLEEVIRTGGVKAKNREEKITIPKLLLYTPKHTWAQMTPEGNIRVGLSDYAQKHLKGMARIRIEPIEIEVKKMETFGVAETWIFKFDLYAPVSGKIIKINERLKTEPTIINSAPYGEGWIVEIKPKNSLVLDQELNSLLGTREYNKLVNKLEGRLEE